MFSLIISTILPISEITLFHAHFLNYPERHIPKPEGAAPCNVVSNILAPPYIILGYATVEQRLMSDKMSRLHKKKWAG